jgi:hypothetical protein
VSISAPAAISAVAISVWPSSQRDGERRVIARVVISFVHIRASVDQRRGDLGVALSEGDVERRHDVSIAHSQVHIRSTSAPAAISAVAIPVWPSFLAGRRRRWRRAETISIGLVGVGAAGQQGRDLVGAAVTNGVKRRRRAPKARFALKQPFVSADVPK